jgi:ABC-2 type transport system ATP-binding protein
LEKEPLMTDSVIELTDVQKRFGRDAVLRGLNLHVTAGQTFAFLGRNGAGKTTTIRMLMGLLKPDAGSVRVLGLDPSKDALEIRRRVGYLAEDQQMWGWMKVREILRFVAAFYPTWDWKCAGELLDKFSLPATAKIRHLSKGQNVRLGLLLALAHHPRVMVLDDPALGLDPIMRKEFLRDVVEHLQGGDVTVFFSSHLLYEIEPVADVVGILDGGRLVAQTGTEALRGRVRQLHVDAAAWEKHGAKLPGVLDVKSDGARVAVVVEEVEIARALLDGAIMEESQLNLDEIFEAYVVGTREAAARAGAAVA